MEKKLSISELKDEVLRARKVYVGSEEKEWVMLALSLRELSDAYFKEKHYVKAAACREEYAIVIKKAGEKANDANILPLLMTGQDYNCYDKTSKWAEIAEEYKKNLSDGASPVQYAEAVNALCEFLCVSGQYQMASIEYKEALNVLLTGSDEDVPGRMNLLIVLSLRAAMCAIKQGDTKPVLDFSVLPLLYIATKGGVADGEEIDWQFVEKLCVEILAKY